MQKYIRAGFRQSPTQLLGASGAGRRLSKPRPREKRNIWGARISPAIAAKRRRLSSPFRDAKWPLLPAPSGVYFSGESLTCGEKIFTIEESPVQRSSAELRPCRVYYFRPRILLLRLRAGTFRRLAPGNGEWVYSAPDAACRA